VSAVIENDAYFNQLVSATWSLDAPAAGDTQK